MVEPQTIVILACLLAVVGLVAADQQQTDDSADWREHAFDYRSGEQLGDQRPARVVEEAGEPVVPCRYLIIEAGLVAKWQLDVSSPEFSKLLYSLHVPGSLEINAQFLKTRSVDNCLDRATVEQMDMQIRLNRSVLYGLDFSSSGLDELKLQTLVQNYRETSHLSIRHLNLTDCRFRSLQVLANLTDYFPDLEALVFDRNRVGLSPSGVEVRRTLGQLKIISMNHCNLNELLPNPEESVKEYHYGKTTEAGNSSLLYLGLSANKLSSLAGVYKLFSALGLALPDSVQVLDFSFNRLNSLDDLRQVLADFEPRKVLLERNLIGSFNVQDLASSAKYVELNLKHNFINNMSVEFFKYKSGGQTKLSVSLLGNPLICDCNTIWLLDEYEELKKRTQAAAQAQTAPKTTPGLNRTNRTADSAEARPATTLKRRKIKAKAKAASSSGAESRTQQSNNGIKLVYKRAMEEISSHHNLDDPNMGLYMQRQKRVKLNRQSMKQALRIRHSLLDIEELGAEHQLLAAAKSQVNIVDLGQLTCKFIDVQNFPSNDQLYQSFSSNRTVEVARPAAASDDYVFYEENIITDLSSLDADIKQQNMGVESVKYREKLISASEHNDYMCAYEDQCNPSECSCCDFRHCHCRSICPKQCKCYYDHKLRKNVIDCSNLNLVNMSLDPIETATDLRLNSNNLAMLKSHAFFGFGQLKYLYLQNNQISYLTSDAFDDLKPSLKILNLASNRLTFFQGDEFAGFKELVILVLNKNPLKDIADVSFINRKSLPSLRLLSMTDTTLTKKKLNELVSIAKAQQLPNLNIKYQTRVKNASVEPTTASPTTMTTTPKPVNKTGQLAKNLSLTRPPPKATTGRTTPKKLTSADPRTRKASVNELAGLNEAKTGAKTTGESRPEEPVNDLINRDINESTLMDDLFGLIINKTDEAERNSSESAVNNTALMNLRTKFFLYQYRLMNWYYFPLAVFVACLVLSFFVILAVILVAKKYESGQPAGSGDSKKGLQAGKPKRGCCCLGGRSGSGNESSLSSSLNYSSNFVTIHSNDIDDIAADEEDDDEDDDASTIDDSAPRCGFMRLPFGGGSKSASKPRKKKLSNAMCPYKSKANYECYNNLTSQRHLNETKVHHRHLVDSVDFATSVPVSRSIHNLTLNVFIYYNVADEDYVSGYLMPFLEQKCLTIIPETNYIKRPQTAKFVSLSPAEMYRSMNRGAKVAAALSTPTTSTEESGVEKLVVVDKAAYHKKSTSSTASTTTGSSSSSSSDCHEESTSLTSSGTSTKTQSRSSGNGAKSTHHHHHHHHHHRHHMLSLRPSDSNSLVANVLIISDNFYGFKAAPGHSDSLSSGRSSQKSKYFKSSSHDSLVKSTFKIYLTFQTPAAAPATASTELGGDHETTTTTKTTSAAVAGSSTLNQGLMRRIYDMNPSATVKNQLTITNDMYSSFAYNERLQFKLERYFENICLKSSTFSNTNFSYVDYSKR